MASHSARRHRSSTAASTTPEGLALTLELRPLLETLLNQPLGQEDTSPILVQTETLQRVRQSLIDAPQRSKSKDVFRQLRGLEALLHTIRYLSKSNPKSVNERGDVLGLLRITLTVLSYVLSGHNGNRRYFIKRVENGGWSALEEALNGLAFPERGAFLAKENDNVQLIGSLLAFALGQDAIWSTFSSTRRTQEAELSDETDTHTNLQSDYKGQNGTAIAISKDQRLLQESAEKSIRNDIHNDDKIQNPEIIPIMFNIWLVLVKSGDADQASLTTIIAIRELAASSAFNLLAVHGSGVFSMALAEVFSGDLPEIFSNLLRSLVDVLMVNGISHLSDGYRIFRESMNSPRAAELLLTSVKSSRVPSYIQFDLSVHGYSSIELPTIHQSFPPVSSSAGYTFCAWIHVDKFDDSCHTTIFGAFDKTQTCFVLIYIEKKTRNLILQTSVRTSRPSIRFKSIAFEEGRWYHIGLIHRRPRTITSSKATLFVDGELKEQIKCAYPIGPPTSSAATDKHSSRNSSSIVNPVQIFLGTPQDLAVRLGKGVVTTCWSLASAHLFGESLSEDLLAVYYRLGPRYNGNYQDCLGSFQTYEASASLNMRNELTYPGKEEKSDIVAAIRSKAGLLMPENRIFLNVSPISVMDDDDNNNIDESQLIKSLSKSSAKSLYQWTKVNGNVIAINGAVPSINEALIQPHGVAILTGKPVVVVPQSLDDVSWEVGGCVPVCLKMIEVARSRDAVLQAVEILLESINKSWRNSEAMERQHGFGILGGLLRGKMGAGNVIASNVPGALYMIEGGIEEREKLSFGLLSLILGFVGYCHSKPNESIIVNQLAYRVLLVDFDMWRKSCDMTQKLYYKQFEIFGQVSIHHEFNSRRMLRMRIVKKLIEAIKGEPVPETILPDFMSALKTLIMNNPSAEVLRSMALFVTYSLHKPMALASRTLRIKKSNLSIRERQRESPDPPKPPISRASSVRSFESGGFVAQKELAIRILELYADVLCDDASTLLVKKFARTVTNKWLLYLLAEDDPRVIVLGAKIIARLLVIHGKSYIEKFATKTGGFVIMQHRLKRWWNVGTIWPICFAILFNVDVRQIDFERPFDLYSLLDTFSIDDKAEVVNPGIIPVIMNLLRSGLQAIVRDEDHPESPSANLNMDQSHLTPHQSRPKHTRKRSMSLGAELASIEAAPAPGMKLKENAQILHTVSQFLTDLHAKSENFRNYTATSSFVQELLFVLFPVIVSSDSVSAETELQSRDSILTFEGSDVVIKSSSHTGNSREAPIIRTTTVEAPPSPRMNRARPVRRGSSFVLVTSLHERSHPSSALSKSRNASPMKQANASNSVIEGLLEIVILVFIDLVMERKDFPGFGLFLKVPPGFQEHQAYFNTYILRNTLSHLNNNLQLNQKLLCEPKVLTNLARFTSHLTEALSEGWFLNGAEPILDFIGTVLEYLQRPDVAKIKSVRLCNQAIQNIRSVFMKVVLLRLSELDDSTKKTENVVAFLDKILYWQTVILSPENTEGEFLKLMCYLMYTKLIDPRDPIRLAAANLWRMTLVQKPEETTDILDSSTRPDQKSLSNGFKKLMELDNETFIYWIDSNRADLDALFFGSMSKAWEEYVSEATRKIDDMIKSRISKRKDRLKQWATEDMANEDTYRRHEVASGHWMSNISASEHVKYLRAMQDMQDDYTFIVSKFAKMDRDLRRPCGLLDDGLPSKWQLDQTEGRNRMRMRLLIDETAKPDEYQPKGRQSSNIRVNSLRVNTRADSSTSIESMSSTPTAMNGDGPSDQPLINGGRSIVNGPFTEEPEEQEEFELVDGPQSSEEGYEDKNRKVIRALQRGDQIQQVYNISRIIGLDFCEGLLILGKDSLYLLDNFFQRSDGEIVNVNQASKEERDSYLQMISGRENQSSKSRPASNQQDSRNWRWKEVLSFSKRRFLFRDVAIEVFFTDGRSYLLTAMSPNLRNDLYSKLLSKAPQVAGSAPLSNPEDWWRLEALRAHDDAPQGFGSKLANVFGPAYTNPATRKWAKGEISNFNYLMLVNTMAGRTFNDLTQYPVFPWVLADYTSEELDLTDPRSFRDLTKPMGCQTSEREAEFRERYQSFAEMGDHNAPPFHYGTHYSSAMIVTSYLIRLQPFVQSYLLLQGGTFDHPDRLFYSIEKAWSSASRNNMTDVRELIPEFFYLPEFLTNSNNFNFGVRQGTGERIDTVDLPPWAKGDPKIFIAKHREALESPYVSRHLHQWIDLIFGFKQKGEAAIEATNVFNYLSYQGAKDLDNIEDSLERLATIGIIHNFGQTPHQVFTKGHPSREESGHKFKRLDTAAESLTRLPFPLLETNERVSSLIFSMKQDRLLCSAAFRLNIPPVHDKYMEWGFVDGSIRFYNAENRKLIGLFEHVHQGQLSAALFADSRTLITSGTDCTVSIWTIVMEPKNVDLQPRSTLFGHRRPVTIFAISRSLSAFLSASLDGVVLLWDLNRLEFVRKLCDGPPVDCARINDITGNILLCSGQTATIYTLNGSLLLSQNLCDDPDDHIASCAFYEGAGNEWLEREIVFTGHRRGVVNIWNKTINGNGVFVLERIKVLNHIDRLRPDGGNVSAAITCILPMPQTVYTGDEDGVVQEWNCVQRSFGGVGAGGGGK